MYKKITLAVLLILCIYTYELNAQSLSLEVINKSLGLKDIVPVEYYFNDGSDTGTINAKNLTNGYHNEGLSALFIDKKMAARAAAPFDFLHINLATKAITRIPVICGNSIDSPQVNTGQLRKLGWGFNGKFYVATHAPSHLIEFDPYSNTVHDYGNPFGNGFNINYMVTNSKDSAVYGVSDAHDHYVCTFRLDLATATIRVDSIYDTDAILGISIQGDNRYTYVITGRHGSKIYSIDRTYPPSPSLAQLLVTDAAAETNAVEDIPRIDTLLNIDFGSTVYKLQNGMAIETPELSRAILPPYPINMDVYPTPVSLNIANYPLIGYNPLTDSVFWKFRNSSVEDGIKISPVVTEIPIVALINYDNANLLGAGAQYSFFVNYSIAGDSLTYLFPSESVSALVPHNNTVYYSSYPGGKIVEFKPALPINIFRRSFITDPVAETASTANPRKIGGVSGNGTGVGPQVAAGFQFINDTTIAFSGNINSDGKRLGEGIGIGTISLTGNVSRVTDTLLKKYGMNNSVLGDNGFVYHAGIGIDNYNGVFFKQNVHTNNIDKFIPYPALDAGIVTKGIENQIVGYTANAIYFLSEVSDEIYKDIHFDKVIRGLHLGYDNNIWILTQENVYSNNYTFYKMDPYSGNYEAAFSFEQPSPPSVDDSPYPYNDFVFVGGDAYLSGTWRIARIQNLAPPVSNSYLSNYDKLNSKFNFMICN